MNRLVFLAGNAIRLAHTPRVQKDARLENGVEAVGAQRQNCPVYDFKCRSVTSVNRQTIVVLS